MQIGGLGFVNTVVSSEKGVPTSVGESGFASLIGGLLSETTESTSTEVESPFLSGLSEEELQGIIDFLKTEDVLDLEGGLKLLDQVLSNSQIDLLSIVKKFLGEVQEFSPIDTKLITDTGLLGSEFVSSELGNSEELMMLIQNLNNLLSLPQEEFIKLVNDDFTYMVKAIKLYDLLVKNQDSKANQIELKGLIEQLTKKFETLMEPIKFSPKQNSLSDNQTQVPKDITFSVGKDISRLQFIQEKFSPIATRFQNNNLSLEKAKVNTETASNLTKTEFVNGTIQFQQVSRPEQLTIMLDKTGRGTNVEDMVKQFENILSKSQFSKLGGTQKLFIKLNPEHLGSLRIELIQKDSMMIAKILTSTATAKDVMESQLNSLKQAFSSQNIQIERIEISQQMTQQERFLNREGQQQHQGNSKQQSNQRNEEQNDENNQRFDLSFEEALLKTEI